jgi:hypothetical protein
MRDLSSQLTEYSAVECFFFPGRKDTELTHVDLVNSGHSETILIHGRYIRVCKTELKDTVIYIFSALVHLAVF